MRKSKPFKFIKIDPEILDIPIKDFSDEIINITNLESEKLKEYIRKNKYAKFYLNKQNNTHINESTFNHGSSTYWSAINYYIELHKHYKPELLNLMVTNHPKPTYNLDWLNNFYRK